MNKEADKFYYRQLIYKDFSDILESLYVNPLTKVESENIKSRFINLILKEKLNIKPIIY